VSVTLGGAVNYFTALVDGASEMTFTTTGQTAKYPIATGLTAGTHTVLLYRLDEASGNANSFEGFDFASGQLLAPAPPSHAIEMIGDSITAGYGNECLTGGTGFTPDMENGYLTYGAITGRDLGADVTVIAWSGKGVHVNYGGSTTDTMPELWLRTLPTNTASTWDFSRGTPGAVVINLGTNDFSAKVAPADYQSSYLSLVQQVHGKYPSATIFCALGPMLNDPDLSTARTAIGNVIDAMKTSGFTQMELVEFPVQDGSVGYGCDYHPNLATHQKMAVVLEQAIHAKLGW
jgi:endoglucanase